MAPTRVGATRYPKPGLVPGFVFSGAARAAARMH